MDMQLILFRLGFAFNVGGFLTEFILLVEKATRFGFLDISSLEKYANGKNKPGHEDKT